MAQVASAVSEYRVVARKQPVMTAYMLLAKRETTVTGTSIMVWSPVDTPSQCKRSYRVLTLF